MTNKEAITWLKDYIQITPFQMEQYEKAFEMAIQALSQEPCTDAVSREAVIKTINNNTADERDGWLCIDNDLVHEIEKLPSVTQKSGKWIDYSDEGYVECPFCGHATNCEDDIDELHYCFYCGAKMVEPQESEDKECI